VLRTWADLTARAATYDLVNHLQKTVFAVLAKRLSEGSAFKMCGYFKVEKQSTHAFLYDCWVSCICKANTILICRFLNDRHSTYFCLSEKPKQNFSENEGHPPSLLSWLFTAKQLLTRDMYPISRQSCFSL